jgi:type II secretory pathway component PulF
MTTLNFTYKVRDPLGKTSEGTLEAGSREEATSKLRKEGYQVVELAEEDEELELLPKRIKQSDIIFLTSQLAVMVDTGITLSAAMQIIAAQEENKTPIDVMLDLTTRVEGGRGLLPASRGTPSISTRPISRSSKPANTPARSAKCWRTSPNISASNWRHGRR